MAKKKRPPGRPPRKMPNRINASPEEIARALFSQADNKSVPKSEK